MARARQGSTVAGSLEMLAEGSEGTQCVYERSGVLGGGPGRHLNADQPGIPMDVDHLAVDAEADQSISAGRGDEPELVAVPATGQDNFVVGCGERGPDVGRGLPGIIDPRGRDDLTRICPALVEQELAETRKVAWDG